MSGRRPWRDDVPLTDRLAWTIPQFAGVLGRDDDYVRDRLTWNPTGTEGVITLPGGVRVNVYRDTNGEAVVYADPARHAINHPPTVRYWDNDEISS